MTAPTTPAAPRTPEEVAAGLDLSDESRALLKPGVTTEVYFDELVKAGHLTDAVRYVARLLPAKRAVWWGSLCVWAVRRSQPKAAADAVLRAVVTWLLAPTDENRRAAEAAGRAAGANTPAGMVGTAAFLTEGSMSAPKQPEVLPEPHFSPALVAGAVLAAARLAGAAKTDAMLRQFLALAVDVYRGTNTWEGKA
jgi:Family of unknown function (DUF6931)